MKQVTRPLTLALNALISEQADSIGVELTKEEHSFMVNALTCFIVNSTHKFILGKREHSDSDFLSDVNHSEELDNEFYDSFWYHSADKYKKQKRKR